MNVSTATKRRFANSITDSSGNKIARIDRETLNTSAHTESCKDIPSDSQPAHENTEHESLPKVLCTQGFSVEYIAEKSWIAHKPAYFVPSPAQFDATWDEHPLTYKTIKMFGKDTPIPRYQQAYGRSYKYSGSVSESVAETPLITQLRASVNNDILRPLSDAQYEFNMCLCNWYESQHYIGPHSDDTRQLHAHSPIASLSWGHARTFVLSPKAKRADQVRKELTLRSGDLVVMGGHCQQTHKHEILKLKSHEFQGNTKRINFTFRCFR